MATFPPCPEFCLGDPGVYNLRLLIVLVRTSLLYSSSLQPKSLDTELALLRTEPMYSYPLETRERAGQRILDTINCKDKGIVKQKKLKKHKDKKWSEIGEDDVILPKIEPVEKGLGGDPHSRFLTVHMKVCLQVGKGRIAKGRRKWEMDLRYLSPFNISWMEFFLKALWKMTRISYQLVESAAEFWFVIIRPNQEEYIVELENL